MRIIKLCLVLVGAFSLAALDVQDHQTRYWMKIKAKDKFERSLISHSGLAIEGISDDSVYAVGSWDDLQYWKEKGVVETSIPLENWLLDFPAADSVYHNYDELTEKLRALHQRFPDITRLSSIGKSVEGRDIWVLRLSGQMDNADQLPGSIFMGGHHAREHLSVDTPLRILEEILNRYEAQDAYIMNLIEHRDIHFIPAVNPDGLEWDISTGSYKFWRKNRSRNSNGSFGVDLNRNYGYQWNTGGSSRQPNSETYMGPAPFSEPETQAIRNYVSQNKNLKILLSFHTFSKLILYPWGYSYDPIPENDDRRIHEVMANKMAQWNGYRPQQASDLYIASGDTTDWAYGELKIISFTFELDPASSWNQGGFYPGPDIIDEVVTKNTRPVLYLIEYSENPKKVLETGSDPFRP